MIRRDEKKLYRFALYGRSGSGKSCLLGAMAVAGQSVGCDGSLATCERLPVEVISSPPLGQAYASPARSVRSETASSETSPAASPGSDSPSQANSEESLRVRSLLLGKQWMEEVVKDLEDGKLPRATPLYDVPPAIDYRIADPQCGEFFIRVVDYSGELINPDAESDPESLTVKLKERLAECDGFLILVEAPRKGQLGILARELRLLREAFHSLRQVTKEPVTTPVGVLITKWDRYSEIDFTQPHEELQKASEFLNRSPEYYALVKSVEFAIRSDNATLESETPPQSIPLLSTGATQKSSKPGEESAREQTRFHFAPFLVAPVSAFGKSTITNGKDIPAGTIQPFNAIQPFVWLTNRRDELDLKACQAEWRKQRNWSWVPFWFLRKSVRRLRAKSKRMAYRMPPASKLRRPLNALRRGIITGVLLSVVTTLITLAALGDASVSAWFWTQVHKAQVVLHSDQATCEEIMASWQEVERLRARFYLGVIATLFFPEKNLEALEKDLDSKHEQTLAHKFRNESNKQKKMDLAQQYLDHHPDGPASGEMRAFLDDCRRQENLKAIADLENAWDKTAVGKAVDDYKSRVNSFQWPSPEGVTPELEKRLQDLRASVGKWYVERKLAELEQHVSEALASGDVENTVLMLVNFPAELKTQQWAKICTSAAEKLVQLVSKRASEYADRQQYDSAVDAINSVQAALRRLEASVCSCAPPSADELLPKLQVLTDLHNQVCESWDEHLYEQVRTERTKSAVSEYLNKAPLRTMSDHVTQYLRYLEALERPLNLEVEVAIFWDPNYVPDDGWFPPPGENYVYVHVEKELVLSRGPLAERPGRITTLGNITCPVPNASAALTIYVTIEEDDSPYLSEKDTGGQGERVIDLKELREGAEILLRPDPRRSEGRV
ncbi:MAG: hypothetical protein NZ899_15150, partial [Thermoguttaceae bacterium]|nr:hypothetical protein [Thermoguttaceae bacterium]